MTECVQLHILIAVKLIHTGAPIWPAKKVKSRLCTPCADNSGISQIGVNCLPLEYPCHVSFFSKFT